MITVLGIPMTIIVGVGVLAIVVVAYFAGQWLRTDRNAKELAAYLAQVAAAEAKLKAILVALVGKQTEAQLQVMIEDTLAAPIAALTGLTVDEVIDIGTLILHELFPPAPTPAPASGISV